MQHKSLKKRTTKSDLQEAASLQDGTSDLTEPPVNFTYLMAKQAIADNFHVSSVTVSSQLDYYTKITTEFLNTGYNFMAISRLRWVSDLSIVYQKKSNLSQVNRNSKRLLGTQHPTLPELKDVGSNRVCGSVDMKGFKICVYV
ncbi:hypothetical protein J6590_080728 [Homalodisca vitripennis]|nr:hypothetical protein J6590_080728 [Homalodisca vitripennis]